MSLTCSCRWMLVSLFLWGCGPSAPVPVAKPAPLQESVAEPSAVSRHDAEETFPTAPVVTSKEVAPPPASPQTVYRPADHRPQHDAEQLAALGIHRWSSKHLVLYSDLEPARVEHLPALVDQLYTALTEYFGPLPPARDGREFQMTGYLMRDLAVFHETGLVPDDLPTIEHGRHRGYEFWLRDQPFDYYRAHLLLHEATHCFMTIVPDQMTPVWYLEGMAEFFGTHQLDPQGRATFGLFPQRPESVPGWGRITLVQRAEAEGKPQALSDILSLKPNEFGEPTPYAWTWAASEFLARHPRYRDRFRELGRNHRGAEFPARLTQFFADDWNELNTEWLLFSQNLMYGYDIERAAMDFRAGEPLTASHTVNIAADRGWQSTSVLVEARQTYRITAQGQVILAAEPKPWLSEANGVTIDYFGGQPLGQLLACIDPSDPAERRSILKVYPLGTHAEFSPIVSGTLYLRVNDAWNRLADNTEAFHVVISPNELPR